MTTQTQEKGILSYVGDVGKYIVNTTGEYLKPTLTAALEVIKEEKKRLVVPALLALGMGLPGFAYGVGLEAFGSVAKKTCETGAAYAGVVQDAGKYEAISGEESAGFRDLSTNLRRAGKMGALEMLAKEISEATKTKVSPSQAYYLDQENKRKAEMQRNPNPFLNFYAQKMQLEDAIISEIDTKKREAMIQAISKIETTIQYRETELSDYLGKEYVIALKKDALEKLSPLQNPPRTYSAESETTKKISETEPAEEEIAPPKSYDEESAEKDTPIPSEKESSEETSQITQEEKRPSRIRGLFTKVWDIIKIDPEKESRKYAKRTEEQESLTYKNKEQKPKTPESYSPETDKTEPKSKYHNMTSEELIEEAKKRIISTNKEKKVTQDERNLYSAIDKRNLFEGNHEINEKLDSLQKEWIRKLHIEQVDNLLGRSKI